MGKSKKIVQSKISSTQHDYKDSKKKENSRALSELICMGKEEVQEESYQNAQSAKYYVSEEDIWELGASEERDFNTTEEATDESVEDCFDAYSTSLEYFWSEDSSEENITVSNDAYRFFSNSKMSPHLLQELMDLKM